MGNLNERVTDELDQLRRLRDELKVRLHLGKNEIKQEWDRLEQRWIELEGRLKGQEELRLHDIGDAAKELLQDVRKGYDHLRHGTRGPS